MLYRTLVADPPWNLKFGSSCTFNNRGGDWGKPRYRKISEEVAPLAYPTMSVSEICGLAVSEIAEPDAHLYLWTVNAFVRDAYDIAEAWGFKPSQVLTWAKTPRGLGLGGAFVPTTEHVLFCRRGSLAAKRRIDTTWWNFTRTKHSVKPDAFFEIVEQVSPGPYAELFARRPRVGWAVWGNEVNSDIDLNALAA